LASYPQKYTPKIYVWGKSLKLATIGIVIVNLLWYNIYRISKDTKDKGKKNMFNLKNASMNIRKAAAIQGIKSGKYEAINHPDNCTTATDLVAIVSNTKRTINVNYGDIQMAHCLTWAEIKGGQ